MKISQLFLCWTFTRLHVTKYPAFCLVPPLLHPILHLTLLPTKHVRRKWIDSHGPSLPPKIVWPWPWPWDLVGKKKNTSMSLKTHPEESSSSCVPGLGKKQPSAPARSPAGMCVSSSRHCDPRGCGAPWVCQPILFNKPFLSLRAFLPMFLAKWGHCLGCPFHRNLCLLLCQAENCLLPWFCLILPVFGESAVRTLNAFLTWGMYFRVW